MNRRPFGINLRISRLLTGLMILAVLKLSVMVVFNVGPVNRWLAERLVEGAAQPVAQALAQEPEETPGQKEKADKEAQDLAQDLDAADMRNATITPPPGVSELDWKAFKKREEILTKKERDLRTLEAEIDRKLEQLAELEKRIKFMLDKADVLKDKKIKHLVDVYSNMKAQQAAQVLETLDEDLAVKILSGMRGRQAGEILGYVSPKKAARLSESLTRLHIPFSSN